MSESSAAARTGMASPTPSDARTLLHRHLRDTTRCYCILGLVAVGVTPLLYTLTRVTAAKRRATLVDLSIKAEEPFRAAEGHPTTTTTNTTTTAAERSPQRADPRAGSTRVSRMTISYSNGDGGHAGGGRRERADAEGGGARGWSVGELARQHSTYLHPIARSVLAHQRASDAVFAHACASATCGAFLRNTAAKLGYHLAVDLCVHVATFGVCAFLDAAAPATAETTESLVHAPSSASSLVSVAMRGMWAYTRGLVVGLFTEGLLKAGSLDLPNESASSLPSGGVLGCRPSVNSAYSLYDFAFSVATPVQACLVPSRWLGVLHTVNYLWHLGQPSNPLWSQAECAAARDPRATDVVGRVWASLTPKGYFAYYLLRTFSQGAGKRVAAMTLRGARRGLERATQACRRCGGTGAKQGPARAETPESSVIPSRRRSMTADRSSTQRAVATKGDKANADASGRSRRPAVLRSMRRVLCAPLVADAMGSLRYAGMRYVMAATAQLLEEAVVMGGPTSGQSPADTSRDGVLGYLCGGRGLCFHVLGYGGVVWFLVRRVKVL